MGERKKGTLMYLSINDFFQRYLKMVNGDLGDNYQILVVSKDIIADEYTKNTNGVLYQSRFENIDFTPELFPHPNVQEYRYSSNINQYGEMYKSQLDQLDMGRTLCCIVDLIVNENVNVYMICSNVEFKMEFFEYMKETVFEKFGLIMTSFEDYLENPDSLYDNGNFDEIKLSLQFQINNLKLIDENIGQFFNKFTKDMAESYKKILMDKSIDELYTLGTKQGLHINKYKPKELIVEHILSKLMDSV